MFQKRKIREAVSNLIQDFEKDGIKALVKYMASAIWAAYGVPFAVFIVSFLAGVSYWLKIPITMPVSLVVVFLGLLLVIILRLRKLEASLRLPKSKRVELGGLVYELAEDGSVSGPLCTRCNAKMRTLSDPNENVTRVVFGKDAVYKYSCRCGNEVVASKPSEELQKEALDYFQKQRLAT